MLFFLANIFLSVFTFFTQGNRVLSDVDGLSALTSLGGTLNIYVCFVCLQYSGIAA